MRILVTNDDGINAHGLRLLEQIARTLTDDVWVVAPETNQSGAGHSLTLRRPLRWRKISERHMAVDGTPTDAVLLAIQKLIPPPKPDLVLSGINHGANLAEDVTYSGTIAAAMEAALFGIPAIALSQVARDRHKIKWATSERWAPDLLRRLTRLDWPEDVLLNINFPDVPAKKVKGVKITRQGKKKLGDHLVERVDPRGEPYIWIGLLKETRPPEPGTDLAAVAEGWISVTPIHLDMTHRPLFRQLATVLGLAERAEAS